MDLEEYLYKNKIMVRSFAKLTGTHEQTISVLKHKKKGTTLLLSLIIRDASKGEIEIETLLSPRSKKVYEDFKKRL